MLDDDALPGLPVDDALIRDSQLSMDMLVRDKPHAEFAFRFIVLDDYRTAM